MTERPTAEQLFAQLEAARSWHLDRLCLDAERKAGLPQGLLLAIASRETGCRNVVGDGGHGRGVFQIDDRWHRDWLVAQGVDSADLVPPAAPAAAYAASILGAALAVGRRDGVAEADLEKFVASAFNAGVRGALDGYRAGDSDRRTTGGDYGRDVVARLAVVRDWLARNGIRPEPDAGLPQAAESATPGGAGTMPLLRPGDQGPPVRALKLAVKAWFDANPPAPPFTLGTLYGPQAAEAVKEFQRRNGLEPDGVVGPKTWAALGAPLGGPAPVLRTPSGRHPRQVPALPHEVAFPDGACPRPAAWMGLQPWIVPQARAIAEHFGLTVRTGHAVQPPHEQGSDHAWGGAVDLVGPGERMVACNLWAAGLAADPWRPGTVFRSAGGPAAGSFGHVHLAWHRLGPATTIFGTPEFP